jgi:hypothetical protein
MKYIKDTNVKCWVTKSGTKESRMFALYECPVCGTLKELRKVSTGNCKELSQSCGKVFCRTVTRSTNSNAFVEGQQVTEYDVELTSPVVADSLGLTHGQFCKKVHTMVKKGLLTDMTIAKVLTVGVYVLTEKHLQCISPVIKSTQATSKSSHLYIVESEGYVKIGIASDVDKRMASLNASSPMEVKLLKYYKTDSAAEVENHLHKRYAKHNHKFEWFTFTEDEKAELINYIEVIVAKSSEEVISATYTQKRKKSGITLEDVKEVVPVDEDYARVYTALRAKVGASNLHVSINTPSKLQEAIKDKWDNEVKSGSCTLKAAKTKDIKAVDLIMYNGKEASATATVRPVVGTDGAGVETIYLSAKEAANSISGTPAHITACCRGNRKTHKGYKWEYAPLKAN